MAPEEITDILKSEFGDAITGSNFETAHPHVVVDPARWHEVATFLRDDNRTRINTLCCITAVDELEDNMFVSVYDMYSVTQTGGEVRRDNEFCVKVRVPRDNPHIPTVADVWRAADWHEREAYDMMGIVYDGHPDSVLGPEGNHPRRILCPDDWEGFPLRKDYLFPMEYHGIPAVTEHNQTRPIH